ncbi:unnamed protein product [Tilletia laevis]|uniref:Transposase n=3 Tax=Tilletia TaxID=13289 RepID=A0A9N8MAY1_9BASI|nr:hypothetical protein CF336_g8872 [Tilletia laevis]KAE8183485.1 hypothetical protein CF328_g8169 [Tilletia controversa]CAD6888915.1 unnamed protein product [Tilletia caries]KAE8193617.1 hypothetical protein CF335_g5545 [Tilletia laevis]KAE8193618.1 hypothetical protein CF335_g5542 [Tilletia laevis]
MADNPPTGAAGPAPDRRAWTVSIQQESRYWPSARQSDQQDRWSPRQPRRVGPSWFSIREADLESQVRVPDVQARLHDATAFLQSVLPPPSHRQIRHNRLWTRDTQRNDGETWRTHKVRILPTTPQKEILRQALGTYRWTYNRALNILKTSTGRSPDLTALRQQCVNRSAFGGDDSMAWVFRTSYRIREQACIEAFEAFAEMRKRQGNINRLRFRKKRALFGSMRVRGDAWKGRTDITEEYGSGGVINGLKDSDGRPFGDIDAGEPITATIEGNITILWENGVWYLMVPFQTSRTKSDVATGPRICAIDPGIRTFATVYDPLRQRALQWGGKNNHQQLLKVARKVDSLLSRMAKPEVGHRKRYKMKIAANRYRRKLKSLATEIHRKLAHWLSKHYDTVLLPSLSAPQISARGQRRIGTPSVRQMSAWAHGKFRQRLMDKMHYLEVPEDYTSRTCSECGTDHPGLGGNSTFACPSEQCRMRADRDVNAAKNIFIKWLFDIRQNRTAVVKRR